MFQAERHERDRPSCPRRRRKIRLRGVPRGCADDQDSVAVDLVLYKSENGVQIGDEGPHRRRPDAFTGAVLAVDGGEYRWHESWSFDEVEMCGRHSGDKVPTPEVGLQADVVGSQRDDRRAHELRVHGIGQGRGYLK